MKSTMFKSMIESGSSNENNDTIKNMFNPELIKALAAYRKNNPIVEAQQIPPVPQEQLDQSDEIVMNIVEEIEFKPSGSSSSHKEADKNA